MKGKKDINKLTTSLLKMYEEGKYRDVKCKITDDNLNALLYPPYDAFTNIESPSRTNPASVLKASILNMNIKLADISERKKYASIIEDGNKIIKLLSEITK